MNTPVLNDNLRSATEALCNLLAKEDQVVSSKAKIGLFSRIRKPPSFLKK